MLDKSILDNNLNDSVSYQEFFKAFGYGINEKVFLRLFDDSKTNKADKGSNLEQDLGFFDNIVNYLKAENTKRRGVYFIVNGGAHTDKAVIKSGCCKTQFFEIDDLSFEEQIDKINEFIEATGLTPSVIIKTHKSLHCYFLLEGNGDITRFRYIQQQLITKFHSDVSIQNESRVMRVYGFNHCKQEPPTLVKLIKFDPDLRYSQDEISKALPPPEEWAIQKPKGKRTTGKGKKSNANTGPDDIYTEDGKIKEGHRHYYAVSLCGEYVNRVSDYASDEAILAMVRTEVLNNCQNPENIDLDDFNTKYLGTIQVFRERREAEQKDPNLYKNARKAWLAENPGKDFDLNNTVTWAEALEALKRAKEAGKTLDDGTQKAAAEAPTTAEPFIDGKINKAYFHHWSSAKIPQPTKPFDSRIRDYVPQRFNIMIFSGIPWIYVKGKWIPDETTAKIRWIIEQFLFDDFKTDTYITRICNLILHTAKLEKTWKDVNQHPITWINFKDCYLDPETMTEHEHRPEYYSLNQIDFNWNEVKTAASGEVTDDFLSFAIPDENDREMLLEYFGYSMTTDNRMQKSTFIYGDGNTGKSTIMNLQKTVLGKDNISGISFQDMSQRFKPSRLVGKLANVCGDLPTQSLKDSSTFKQLTGNDEIDTERKNKDGFSFVNYAKMIFSTNGLPIIEGERSAGTFRRLLLIAFQQIPPKIDPLLPDKLDKEILYFIRLQVEALHRMYERGYILESNNSKEAIKQLRQDSDITQAWLDNCTRQLESDTATRQDIRESFKQYCIVEERTPLKPNSLYAALRAKGFQEYRTANERGFKGIRVNMGIARK